jgi:hypothetical protein
VPVHQHGKRGLIAPLGESAQQFSVGLDVEPLPRHAAQAPQHSANRVVAHAWDLVALPKNVSPTAKRKIFQHELSAAAVPAA